MMRFGCLASLALYGAAGLVILRPALLPIAVMFLALMLMVATIRDPDWPLY